MDERVLRAIEESEMVLVGVGGEFSPAAPDYSAQGEAAPYLYSRFYESLPDDHEVICAYNRLRELIGKRPYFVVTLNTDDLIYRSSLEREKIVAPCGSMAKLQCREHIVDACEIRERVLSGQTDAARCPHCGEPLKFHTVQNEDYLESGYLPQWEKYKKWLALTMNRKLCVLELGVGFDYPQVIRWPFTRTAFYNKKAVFVRVNSRFPQIEAELAEKAVSVAASPIQLFCEK